MKTSSFFTIISFVILAGMTGCINSENVEPYSIQTPSSGIMTRAKNLYDNGLVYINADTAEFLEYESFTGTTLCNKPNCSHNNSSCISKMVTNFGQSSTPPIIYRDNVYYFTSSGQVVDHDDAKSTYYDIECQLYKVGLHTGDSELVCEFTGMESTTSETVFLQDGVLYFIANNGSLQTQSGAWSYFSSAGLQYLCSVNLDSGEFVNYGQINDTEKAQSTLFAVGEATYGINGNVSIKGIYENKLWMCYYYADSAEDLYTVFKNTGDFPNISDPVFHRENVTFDFDSKKLEVSSEPDAVCIGNGYYVYWDSSQNQYIAKNENKEITLRNFAQSDILQIHNNIVWDLSETGRCYNLKTGTQSELSDKYKEKEIEIIGFADNSYIIQFFDDDSDKVVFEGVSESNLIGY